MAVGNQISEDDDTVLNIVKAPLDRTVHLLDPANDDSNRVRTTNKVDISNNRRIDYSEKETETVDYKDLNAAIDHPIKTETVDDPED